MRSLILPAFALSLATGYVFGSSPHSERLNIPSADSREWFSDDPLGFTGNCEYSRRSIPELRDFIWRHWKKTPAKVSFTTAFFAGKRLKYAVVHLSLGQKGNSEWQAVWTVVRSGKTVEQHTFNSIAQTLGSDETCNAEQFHVAYRLIFGAGEKQQTL